MYVNGPYSFFFFIFEILYKRWGDSYLYLLPYLSSGMALDLWLYKNFTRCRRRVSSVTDTINESLTNFSLNPNPAPIIIITKQFWRRIFISTVA
jgi:hypothetical protein